MSSIYLYIIYISRPWFKGSGAAAGSGSISDIHSLRPLLPLCYSTHKSSFCEEERVQRWPSFSLSSSTGGEIGCVPEGFNQKHAGCRETSGVFCCERGSGLWVQGCGFRVQGCGGGFAEILRLRSQLFWHSLSLIRRFSPLRMTKRGDARLRLGDFRLQMSDV